MAPAPTDSPPEQPAVPGGALRRRLSEIAVPEESPAAAVYGLIAIGALLAAESGRHESYLDTLLSALVATLLYWLLHAYARVLGSRLAAGERLSARAILTALGHDHALLAGAAIPLAALLIGWVGGASQATAVIVALWSVIVGLVLLELLAGLRSGARGGELALDALVGALLGLAVLSLKIILH